MKKSELIYNIAIQLASKDNGRSTKKELLDEATKILNICEEAGMLPPQAEIEKKYRTEGGDVIYYAKENIWENEWNLIIIVMTQM